MFATFSYVARHDIADSLQDAYESLKLQDAQTLLMLKSADELQSFITEVRRSL